MERFLKRHEGRIIGTIAGFDRILFRGSLMSICYQAGIERFVTSQRVLFKDFASFVIRLTDGLKEHVKEYAEEHGRPVIYLNSPKQSKEELARQLIEKDQITEGLICILSCLEPCQSFGLRRDRQYQELRIVPQERKCLHYYFYFLDKEFGFMHVRLQSWLPMTIQVCLNGREYLARQMETAGIGYEQYDNSFTQIDDLARAQVLLDGLVTRQWGPTLNAFARLVNPWLRRTAEPHLRPYYWTMRQGEYATDVMFRDQRSLQEIYSTLYLHAIKNFSSENVLRFLARRSRNNFAGEVRTDLQQRVEGVRVKHWVNENSLKMYDKGGSLLRIETTINNPRRFSVRRRGRVNGKKAMRWLPLRKGIADIRRRGAISHAANARYLVALSVVGETRPSHLLLDPVTKRVESNGRRYRPLHPISADESKLYRAILRGEHQIQGIRNEDLRQHLFDQNCVDERERRRQSGRVTRLLQLLRAHKLIYKILKTNYYRITKKGHEVMTTALNFRDTDLALLAT
jgi:hypothetical protein